MKDRKMEECVFIGGSADGRRIAVLQDQRYWSVIVQDRISLDASIDTNERTYTKQTYRRRFFKDDVAEYSVFVWTEFGGSVLAALLDRYTRDSQ